MELVGSSGRRARCRDNLEGFARLQHHTSNVCFFGDPKLPPWINRSGNRERIEHLKWARDNRNGLFQVIIAAAVDVMAEPHEIDEAYNTQMVMRLTDLDETTGEFSEEVMQMRNA